MTTAIDVSIVIVNWNTCDLLRDCLESIYAATTEHVFEVLVVDNGSTDASFQMTNALFPEVKVIANEENVGFARANNQALKQAKGLFCLFLNSDTVVTTSAIDLLAETLGQDSSIGVAGPQLLNSDGSVQPSFGDFPSAKTEVLFQSYLYRLIPTDFPLGGRIHRFQKRLYDRRHQVDWVSGAALMARRDLIESIGGIDETLFMYGEDVELCWRVAERGFKSVYIPEAKIVHYGGGSRRNHARWIENYTRGHIAFYKRHCSKWTWYVACSAIILGSLLRTGAWFVIGQIWRSHRKEASERIQGYRQARTIAWHTLSTSRS